MVSGVVVVVAAGFALKRPILEQWYLRQLESEDGEEQRTAIQKLGELRSASAVPKLVELFRKQNTRRSFGRDDLRLREALVAIGEPAVPHLIELTRDHNRAIRSAAWTVLGEVGPVAVSNLLENLDHIDVEDRVQLLHNLRATDAKTDKVPIELIHACGDANPRVRAAAISTIATVAPESHATIDALLRALKDDDKMVRFVAAVHFGGLSDPRAKAAVPELTSAVMDEFLGGQGRMTHTRLGTQRFAVVALSQLLKNLSHPVPPELIHACGDANPRVRAAAIAAIATVAPESRATIDTVLNALTDGDKMVRFTAAARLGELSDPRAKAAIPELILAVRDDSLGRERRETAVRLLGLHRSTAAVPALIETLNDDHRVVVVWALARIGPPASAAIPILKKLAANKGYIAQQANRALTAIQSEDAMDDEQE